jgi:hypothetical protein
MFLLRNWEYVGFAGRSVSGFNTSPLRDLLGSFYVMSLVKIYAIWEGKEDKTERLTEDLCIHNPNYL